MESQKSIIRMIEPRPSKPWYLLAIAIGLVTLLFFDIVFLGRTLQPSNIQPRIYQPANWEYKGLTTALNPRIAPYFGFGDLGATAWQSEPARYLMARNFREDESPYWNPYSAAGSLGPETLVDIKFSPFTLVSAYFFNSSAESFDYGLLMIYALGTFFILLILNHSLQLSLLASVAGALIYLLNGFALPNLNSHMGQPYFFFPFLLYALFRFSEKQNLLRFVWLVLAHMLLLLITFLPTLILVLLTVHLINLVYFYKKKNVPRHLGLVFLSGVTAFLITGALWWPVIDSFFVSDIISDFNSRSGQVFRGPDNLLSIFTPKHFWENYSGSIPGVVYPGIITEMDASVIAHTGIFAGVIASFSLPGHHSRFRPTILLCTLLLVCSYARVFGLMDFMDHLPVFRSIGVQYWGCVSAISLVILVAFGMENILSAKISLLAPVVVLFLLGFFFLVLFAKLGFVNTMPYHQYLKIILFLFGLACLSIWLIRQPGNETRSLAVVMLVIMLLELLFYMNQVRPKRYDPLQEPPEFVTFLKKNIQDGRVLNIGLNGTLYPEYGAMYGIRQAGTQNPGRLPWYRDFFRRHLGSDTGFFLTLGNFPERNQLVLGDRVLSENALDVAGVKYILVVKNAAQYHEFFRRKGYPLVFQKGLLTIFENPDYFHTATLIPALLQVETLPQTSSFHPGTTAITTDPLLIEQAQQLGIPLLASPGEINTAPFGNTRILSYHNTDIVLEAESTQPAILALAETWHPSWKATVNGQPAYVGRINEAFRGIALPAGKHRIHMVYDSTALRYGFYGSAVAVLFLVALFLATSGIIGFYGFPKHRG